MSSASDNASLALFKETQGGWFMKEEEELPGGLPISMFITRRTATTMPEREGEPVHSELENRNKINHTTWYAKTHSMELTNEFVHFCVQMVCITSAYELFGFVSILRPNQQASQTWSSQMNLYHFCVPMVCITSAYRLFGFVTILRTKRKPHKHGAHK